MVQKPHPGLLQEPDPPRLCSPTAPMDARTSSGSKKRIERRVGKQRADKFLVVNREPVGLPETQPGHAAAVMVPEKIAATRQSGGGIISAMIRFSKRRRWRRHIEETHPRKLLADLFGSAAHRRATISPPTSVGPSIEWRRRR